MSAVSYHHPLPGTDPTAGDESKPGYSNNFDLIRLLAALQVVCGHASAHLHIDNTLLQVATPLIGLFPGVPIFFALSGFLVYWSYDRNTELRRFFQNRALRVYPGLWAAFLVTCGLLLGFGVIKPHDFFTRPLAMWVLTQVTIFPVYTPDLLRPWGAHNPNGSLWTIVVELQYYITVPLLHRILSGAAWRVRWLALFAGSLASMVACEKIPATEHMLDQLAGACVVPYLFYFLFGIFLYKDWPRISRFVSGKGLYWLGAYLAFAGILCIQLKWYRIAYRTSWLGLVGYAILDVAIISLAYTAPRTAQRALRGNDVSYGIYVYHMLVVNSFMALGLSVSGWLLPAVYAVTLGCSYLSWIFIESPALRLKYKASGRAHGA